MQDMQKSRLLTERTTALWAVYGYFYYYNYNFGDQHILKKLRNKNIHSFGSFNLMSKSFVMPFFTVTHSKCRGKEFLFCVILFRNKNTGNRHCHWQQEKPISIILEIIIHFWPKMLRCMRFSWAKLKNWKSYL